MLKEMARWVGRRLGVRHLFGSVVYRLHIVPFGCINLRT